MSGTELVLRSSDVPADFTSQLQMARAMAEASLLPAHLRRQPANVLIILMGARALDISAFWALQAMHVVEGKLGLSAELMRALVNRAGHQVRVVERSTQRAVVEIKRRDRDTPYRAEFTRQDAELAGLLALKNGVVQRDGWRKYPKSMLVARATSIAVRDEVPEVMCGLVYTPEELGADVDADGRVLDAEVVAALTDEQVAELARELEEQPLEQLPVTWSTVVDRAAQYTRLSGADDSLADVLLKRLVRELAAAKTRKQARALWYMTGLLPAELREGYLAMVTKIAENLPDEPAETAEATTEPARPEVDTEHARNLREAAAASWGPEDAPATPAHASDEGVTQHEREPVVA